MVAEDYEGTGNKSGKRESRLMSIQRRLRDQELLYEQLKIEEDLRELDAVRNENSSPSPVKQNDLHDRSIEHKEWENGSKLRGHEGLYGAQLSTTQPPSFNHRRNIQLNSDHSHGSFFDKVPMSSSETFSPISDHCNKETVHTTLLSRYHSYPSNLRGSTILPGNQRLRKDVLVGQQRSVSSHASYSDCSNDVREKIRIAREAEKHWTRVKNEQRARLGHVIHDVNTRKEIEEVYFRAQLQLCRVRREIAMLEQPRYTPPGLSCPVGLPSNDKRKVPKFCSEDLPGKHGAFRPYVKNMSNKRDDDSEVQQRSMNDSNSQKLKTTSRQLQERMPVHFSDEEKNLGEVSELDVGLLENSPKVKARKDLGCIELNPGIEAEEEEGSSDEFDDDEEEELMILRSDSSSGHRSQDELRDSLREEQEKLEEIFRQQKERFKKEQEKLKEEEEKIKEWEIREQLKEGEKKSEDEAKDDEVPDECTKTKEQQQGEIGQREHQQRQQQQKQHQQHQVERKHNKITTSVQESNFIKNNGDPSNELFTKTTSLLFNSESVHRSDDNNYTSEKLTKEQVEVDVSGCLGNINDVSELEQICVAHGDTDEETRQEIEEELIKILKEGKSTDEEEEEDLTDEETEMQKREGKNELTILQPDLHDDASNFEEVLKRNDLEESDNVELLNQMIDDLMIQDQGTEEGDGGVNMDHVGVHSIGEKSLDSCESNGDDISSTDMDIKFEDDEFALTDMLCEQGGDPIGHEEGTRRSGSEESLDIKDEVIRSRYLESSDEVRDKVSQDHQRTQEMLKDNGHHAHDVALENCYEDSTVIDGIDGDTKADQGKAEGNVDSSIGRKLEDNMNNNSVTIGDNLDERRIDDASIDVDFNIDLSEDNGTFKEDVSLIDLLRGSGQTSESEGSLEGDDDDIGIPEAEQGNEDNVGYSESHMKVNDELVETPTGHIQGDNEIQDVTVVAKTQGESKRTHGITVDKKDFHGELHLRSESSESDDESDSDFGTLLEDIEEEGSEYEDLMGRNMSEYEDLTGSRSAHLDKKDSGHKEQDVITMEPSTSGFRSLRFTDENMNENQV